MNKRIAAAGDEFDSSNAVRGGLPLQGLEALDAIVESGSFAGAAQRLRLTPSAISHRLRLLETTIGATLFRRSGREMVLTPEGRRLADWSRRGFASLERGVAEIREGDRANQIRVSVLALIEQTILIPALSQFTSRWPQYSIHLETTTRYANFDVDDVDVAIRVGQGDWPGLEKVELLRISGMPVARRDYIDRQGIAEPDDLRSDWLIHDSRQPRAWEKWLSAQLVESGKLSGGMQFDSAPATMLAAEQGIGVALGIAPLIYEWPGFGQQLVEVFPGRSGPSLRYWIVFRPEQRGDRKIRAFVNWARAACGRLGSTYSPAQHHS